jgi:DNA-directed RNA polymerase I, II, and III subunit RPABC2
MADIDETAGADYEEEAEVFDEEELDGDQDETGDRIALKKLYQNHPECVLDYNEQVITQIPLKVAPPRRISALEQANMLIDGKNTDEAIGDPHHTTYPFLTKYEYTRIIGFRANQLSQGAQSFVNIPEHVSDVREIARLELAEKRLPFIIKRPLPDGSHEYWRLQDLLQI